MILSGLGRSASLMSWALIGVEMLGRENWAGNYREAAAAARRRSRLLQLLLQERHRQRGHVGGLLQVRRARVSAFDVLVVEDVVPLRREPRDHLARVSRMHAIVARGAREQDARILRVLRRVLV